MRPPPPSAPRPTLQVVGAFATIYLVWGSTYLAIRYAIESFPPLLMMGIRSLVAGAVLLAWTRWRGRPAPTRREWVAALWVGALLFLVGHGSLSWAETRMASGPAALIVATLPVWMAVLERAPPGGDRPGRLVFGGIALGLAGVGLLVAPADVVGGGRIDLLATGVLLVGTLSWAAGSVYGRGLGPGVLRLRVAATREHASARRHIRVREPGHRDRPGRRGRRDGAHAARDRGRRADGRGCGAGAAEAHDARL